MQLRLAADLADEGRPPTAEALRAMHHGAADAIDELRDLAQGLYPTRIRELGLARSLQRVARRSPILIAVDDDTGRTIDGSMEIALYFVCVEAIQDATKHGTDATRITVTLSDDGDDLVVSIEDDGPGFEPAAHRAARGLLNMSDRVGALGGELTIDAEPGRGTTVTARLPADHDELAVRS
jgi:signal transduction histidine kinase